MSNIASQIKSIDLVKAMLLREQNRKMVWNTNNYNNQVWV